MYKMHKNSVPKSQQTLSPLKRPKVNAVWVNKHTVQEKCRVLSVTLCGVHAAMCHITTFWSMTDLIYDGGSIIL